MHVVDRLDLRVTHDGYRVETGVLAHLRERRLQLREIRHRRSRAQVLVLRQRHLADRVLDREDRLVEIACLLRMRRAPFVQWLLVLSAVVPLLILVPAGIASADFDLRLPYVLSTLVELGAVSMWMPLLLAAWAFGTDQQSDTWKLLLVRQPRRALHVVSK